jgi:hypothetical protein
VIHILENPVHLQTIYIFMEKKKKPEEFEITELFLVKAGNDFTRTFVGQIYRETTAEGVSIVRGSVIVNEGKIWAASETIEILGQSLDDLCILKLDYGLHANTGVTSKIFKTDFFLN